MFSLWPRWERDFDLTRIKATTVETEETPVEIHLTLVAVLMGPVTMTTRHRIPPETILRATITKIEAEPYLTSVSIAMIVYMAMVRNQTTLSVDLPHAMTTKVGLMLNLIMGFLAATIS